jgi:hypothetical protein
VIPRKALHHRQMVELPGAALKGALKIDQVGWGRFGQHIPGLQGLFEPNGL